MEVYIHERQGLQGNATMVGTGEDNVRDVAGQVLGPSYMICDT